MARYDDGGIEFAEQQFAAARKYKEEQAKKTEKFAKRMLAVQGIAKMGNAIMNAKAEELEKKQAPQRAAYDAWNTRANNLKLAEQTRQSENKSVHDYLATLYSTQLIEQLTAEYPTRNINLLKPYAIREGKRLAKENQSEYEEMISSANAIPTFENFPEYYASANIAPRSIGDWISKGVRRGFRRNNQETIDYDNQQADPLYGTGLWKKYGEFADSLEQYDLVTGKGYELTQLIEQAKKDGRWKGAEVLEKAQIVEDKEYDTKTNTYTTTHTMIVPTRKEDGSIEIRPENRIPVNQEQEIAEGLRISNSDLKDLLESVKKEYIDPATGNIVNPRKELQNTLYSQTAIPGPLEMQAALRLIADNPAWSSINWSDEKNKEEAFENYRNRTLKWAIDPDTKQHIAQESPIGSGNWVIKIRYRDNGRAEELGFDEISLKKNFEAYADSSQLYQVTQSISTSSTLNKTKSIMELVTTSDELNFIQDMKKPDSWFFDLADTQIEEAKNKGESIVIFENVDLSAWPKSPFKGTYNIYYDIDNNKIYFK